MGNDLHQSYDNHHRSLAIAKENGFAMFYIVLPWD